MGVKSKGDVAKCILVLIEFDSTFAYLMVIQITLNLKTMKLKIDDIPVLMEGPGTIMKRKSGFGKLDVTYNELPAGTDFTPLLVGLNNDSCHCEHWGYIIEGAFRVIYDDDTEETLRTGDVFFLPAGHTALVEEDVKCIMFSPEDTHEEVLTHAMNKMTEMSE